jgi:type II secretory pathway pseudopilin PulG
MKRNKEAGFIVLLEMLVAVGVLLVLLAIATPSALQIQNSQNAQTAKTQVFIVRNAEAAQAVCIANAQTTCTALTYLIPQPGPVTTAQFNFVMVVSGSTWSYSAAPISNIKAPQSFYASSADPYVHCSFVWGVPATAASAVCP